METNTAETLDTWAVTAAYQHPTPRLPAPSWSCGGYENPNAFDPADQDALVEAQAVCAGCEARSLCLTLGTSRREWGVWGGVLLEDGEPIEKVRQRGRPRKATAA